MITPATGNTITPANHHNTIILRDTDNNPFRHHHAPALPHTAQTEGQRPNYNQQTHSDTRGRYTSNKNTPLPFIN